MAVVVFYEKAGCGTNARQKRILEAAGHTVVTRNLLTERWTAERLRGFFGDTDPASWFNAAAPRVKSGDIDPERMDAATALTLMLAEPLLIRRPLLEVDEQRAFGFDGALIRELLGTERADVQGCGRPATSPPCPDPNHPSEPGH